MNRRKILITLLFAGFLHGFLTAYTADEDFERGLGTPEPLIIEKIIDGDSLQLKNGKGLRYLGINTPEYNEAFGGEAKKANETLLKSNKNLFFQRCLFEAEDKYNRVLALVFADGVDVQSHLLEKGLAVPAAIAPCGLITIYAYEKIAAKARKENRGLWRKLELLSPENADSHLKEYRGVRGRVKNIHDGKSAFYLNFGDNYKTDFSAMILKRDVYRFHKAGVDLRHLKDKKITVYGFISERNGPEITLYAPEQLLLEK